MKIDLSDKTVLMTGALGGIAESVIAALTAAGATVVATDKQPTAPIQPYFPMDVTDSGAVDRVVATAFTQYPGINIALGHAGGTGVFPFETCDRETFDKIIAFNFLGQTYFARAVLRAWRKRNIAGHLVFTSSFTSKIPMAGIAAYVSSKAALEMFAKNLALEYAPHKIRVNCVSPGNVAVGSSKKVYEEDPVYRAWVERVSPLGARNSPEGVANAFLYLCSPLADEVDGHVLQVDMGVGLPKLG